MYSFRKKEGKQEANAAARTQGKNKIQSLRFSIFRKKIRFRFQNWHGREKRKKSFPNSKDIVDLEVACYGRDRDFRREATLRDITHLRTFIGVPVEYSKAKQGGFDRYKMKHEYCSIGFD